MTSVQLANYWESLFKMTIINSKPSTPELIHTRTLEWKSTVLAKSRSVEAMQQSEKTIIGVEGLRRIRKVKCLVGSQKCIPSADVI